MEAAFNILPILLVSEGKLGKVSPSRAGRPGDGGAMVSYVAAGSRDVLHTIFLQRNGKIRV